MRRCLLLLFTLLVLTSTLSAQSYSKCELHLNGGIAEPFYPRYLRDNWRWGFDGGIGLGYRLMPELLLDASVDFYSFRFDDFDYYSRLDESSYITTVDGKLSWVASLSGNARYFVNLSSDETFFFLTAGAGLQRIHIGEINVIYQTIQQGLVQEDFSASTTNYGFQFHFGVGLDLVSSEDRSYYLEVRYVVGLFSDYTSHFLPVKVGIRQKI